MSNKRDNVEGKKMGISLLFLISNSVQINHQIEVPRSCCTFFLSQGKRTISFWTGSSQKKWLQWQGIWTGGGSRCKCIFREERGTWSRGVAMPGLSEEPVVQDCWSITSTKNGKSHWKGRLGPWYTHGTARRWTGYLPKTKLLPLRSLQL